MTAFMFIALWLGAVPSVQTAEPPRVLASSANWTITTDDYNAILNSLPEQTRVVLASPENRRGFLEDLIQIWVLAEAGRQNGTDKVPEIKAMVNFYANNIVAREYRDNILGVANITPEQVEAYYKDHPEEFSQVQLSHILIVNSDSDIVSERQIEGGVPLEQARRKIEDIKARMQAGANFEELAKQFSQDTGSAELGGELGFISKGQLTPTVEKAAFALVPGGYSDIVESPFGFHILHVTDRIVSAFEEVESEIRQKITSERLTNEIETRLKAADVKVDEDYFKQ